jgi:hypothetical protein
LDTFGYINRNMHHNHHIFGGEKTMEGQKKYKILAITSIMVMAVVVFSVVSMPATASDSLHTAGNIKIWKNGILVVDVKNTATSLGKDTLAKCAANLSGYTGNNCAFINLSISTGTTAPAASDTVCEATVQTSSGFNNTIGTASIVATGNYTSYFKWTATGTVSGLAKLCLLSYNGSLMASGKFANVLNVESGDNVTGQYYYAFT